MVRTRPWRALTLGLCLASLGPLFGCGPAPMTTPTSFLTYNSADGTFACEYPEGWLAEGKAKRAVWAKFTSGDAKIDFRVNVSGSLMADAMGGRGGDPDLPPDLQPVHILHVGALEQAQDDLPNYKELPGSPVELECKVGPARLSEFTCTTTLGTSMHGYRVTTIGHKKAVAVLCLCREGDWQALKPAFDHTLMSITRGVAE